MTQSAQGPEENIKLQNNHFWGDVLRRMFAVPEAGVLLPLLIFIGIFYAFNPHFLSWANISTMLRAMSFIGVIAMGQAFLLISGAFDLSVGTTAGLCSIVTSYLMVNMQYSVPAAIICGLLTGAIVGLINSWVVLKLGVPAFIATLGMLNITKGITFLISKGYTIYPLPASHSEVRCSRAF